MAQARCGSAGIVAIVAVLLAVVAPAFAATPNDGQLGGAATVSPGASSCPAGVPATGISGNRGMIGISPIAATVTVECRGGAASGTLGTHSGEGSGSTSCGPGEVAVGIVGREGDFIDQIAVLCQDSDFSGSTASAAAFPADGTGGGPDGPYGCSMGQWLGGLTGSVFGTPPDTLAREVAISCFAPDSDGDGVQNASDNCVAVANPGQEDTNGTAFGNACATVQSDGRLGGPPGIESGSSMCPAGKAVTGAEGNEQTIATHPIVGTVTVQCEGGAGASGAMGTYSGPEGSGATSCPAGKVAVGVEGGEGDFIDRLAVRCRNADLTGAVVAASAFGGPGGSQDGPYDCPAGQRLAGLSGSMVFGVETVRELAISCESLPAPTVPGTNQASSPPPSAKPTTTTPRVLTATVSDSWRVKGRYVLLRRLVVNHVPAWAAVTVTCKGKGCPFKSRGFSRNRRGQVVATGAFAKSRLRPGAVVQVRITAPGAIGRVVTFSLRKGKAPRSVTQCLPLGSTRPADRC